MKTVCQNLLMFEITSIAGRSVGGRSTMQTHTFHLAEIQL